LLFYLFTFFTKRVKNLIIITLQIDPKMDTQWHRLLLSKDLEIIDIGGNNCAI
jgi:hypothetical protein